MKEVYRLLVKNLSEGCRCISCLGMNVYHVISKHSNSHHITVTLRNISRYLREERVVRQLRYDDKRGFEVDFDFKSTLIPSISWDRIVTGLLMASH